MGLLLILPYYYVFGNTINSKLLLLFFFGLSDFIIQLYKHEISERTYYASMNIGLSIYLPNLSIVMEVLCK